MREKKRVYGINQQLKKQQRIASGFFMRRAVCYRRTGFKAYERGISMNLGEKIRCLRKERKLTQEQLAEYMNVSAQAVSKWETGASGPDVDMLPRLAAFFDSSIDELLDFDRRRIEAEVDALVTQSVPLRKDPARAEAFYREALRKYPNNEVLLNCLLMVIPNDRMQEMLEIGEQLLACSKDDEIRLDVLRLLALTCYHSGETAMARLYLARLPELYFLKTEYAAFILDGEDSLREIRKTEDVCLAALIEMLALRIERSGRAEEKENCAELARQLLSLYRRLDEYAAYAERLEAMFQDGSILKEAFT